MKSVNAIFLHVNFVTIPTVLLCPTMNMLCHQREPQDKYRRHTGGGGFQSEENWGKI